MNVGMIIFGIIFIYIIFNVYTYLRREKVQFYEVTEGSIVNDRSYTGIILRKEEVQYPERPGYINYYVREGKRTSVGTSIYSIDETGTMAKVLASNSGETMDLSNEDLRDIKKEIASFSLSYRDETFYSVYDTKYSLEAMVMKYVNLNALDNLEQIGNQSGVSFTQARAPKSGVVSYGIDSYEDLQPNQISQEVFDRTAYQKKIIKSGDLVSKEHPAYKIVTDENWSVVFPMTENDVADYGTETSLKVSFRGKPLITNGQFSMSIGSDGNPYGKLDFSKYMIQFVSDRYVDFEIISSKVDGLKIPVSSVTVKDLYLVPVDFLTKGGDSLEDGFHKEIYSEAGTSIMFVPVSLYNSTDEYYYIDIGDGSQLKVGDYIVKPNSTERYQIGPTEALKGVYNINKGYTIFKQIEVLYQNDEFYTVKKGTSYGLSAYDHIVLDASLIEREGVLIYQ